MFNQSYGYSLADIAAVTGGNRNNGAFGDDSSWWIVLLFLLCLGGGWNNGGGFLGGGGSTREEIAYGFDMNGLENGVRGIQQGLCDGFYAMNTGMLNGFSGIQSTLCQGFSGVNAGMAQNTTDVMQAIQANTVAGMQNTNALTAQLTALAAQEADCCCKTQSAIKEGFADLGYNLATQACDTRRAISDTTRDIIDNQNAGVRSILDFLTQDKISTLTAENQALKFAASQQAQNAYLVSELRPCPVPAYTVPNPYCCTTSYTYGTGCCGNNF